MTATATPPPARSGPTARPPKRSRFWVVDLYRSALGKKYVMAVTGIVFMGYVAAHMVGNLKLYVGEAAMNEYAVWLTQFGYPALPHYGFMWVMRGLLLASLIFHVHAAYALTRMNRKARPTRYQSKRDYVAADFAARTMRWTGVIILLFIGFHLMDLTIGPANPNDPFTSSEVYANVVASFQRPVVAIVYVVANLALGLHLYHGSWSLFQTMGWNNRRFNTWRRWFAIGFAVVIAAGNISFPLAVMTGIVS